MKHRKVKVLGMEMDLWSHEGCAAQIATGNNWATLYLIESTDPGKGHATELLRAAKKYYEAKGLTFGGSVALNERMRKIYEKLDIKEYSDLDMEVG